MTTSLLSKKDRERLTDAAKVQKLVRIGRRAVCRADWLEGEELSRYYASCATPEELAQRDVDVAAAKAKAKAAADEIVAIASASDDLDLRRRARAAGALR